MRDTKEIINFNDSKKKINHLQYGDEVIVNSILDFGSTPGSLSKPLAKILLVGADIKAKSENKLFSKTERSALIPFIIVEYYDAMKERKSLQEKGILAARNEGKYKGRAKFAIDKAKFEEALIRTI